MVRLIAQRRVLDAPEGFIEDMSTVANVSRFGNEYSGMPGLMVGAFA